MVASQSLPTKNGAYTHQKQINMVFMSKNEYVYNDIKFDCHVNSTSET
jgi:hypothetical protein